ncbi:CDP-alcohol phosphatidyltransferase family protein [Knoellia sp. S7-12]|uniref:CDP-alcohol phosphatidyltransferase family protein n=1 Tax=Knoellia sp. S7-12 TaxID=3126698 RepID=UPI0033687127
MTVVLGSWGVGLGCGAVLIALLRRGLGRAWLARLGPADVVTLVRGLMACAVAALTVQLVMGHDVRVAVVAVAVPGLALDGVDGWVARRTSTVTALGARFDGEVDAFLILVLSVAAAPTFGWWVLTGGLARYAFGVAGWVAPWMQGALEFRYWRKVVAAAVGIVLVVAVADVLPRGVALGALVGAHVLLAESFGRDVWSLWRGRAGVAREVVGSATRWGGLARSAVVGVVAVALLWFVLVAPNQLNRLTPGSFLRMPVEIVAFGALVLVVPARLHRVVVAVPGMVVSVVLLFKVLDLGAFAVLDRPFNLVTDVGLLGSGWAFVRDSWGPWAAVGSIVAVLLVLAVVIVGPVWAVGRMARVVVRDRRRGVRGVVILAAVWALGAVTGLQSAAGATVSVSGAVPYVAGKVRAAETAYRDRVVFRQAIGVDPYRTPVPGELDGLEGKDVVVVFVESYGRVALEGAESQPVRTVLDSGTQQLRSLGFEARSGYLTSTTFGGSSWLAHSTLLSGLAVSDQSRYDLLLSSDRTTLASAFSRAGWRTVALMPSTRGDWPEGQVFYGFDEVLTGSELRYAGPRFGFSAVPDQFALSAFGEMELGDTRPRPVMAQVELTSSHGPWAPLPTMVSPSALGDGSVFNGQLEKATTAAELWRDRSAVPAAFRESIVYSLSSVISFAEQEADDDLVLVVLGDHQPATIISGFDGKRDVPVSVIARDPKVMERIASWGWQDGLRPGEGSPVWPMADFRDRFLGAFGGVAP